MDRVTTIREHLEQARRHIAIGERNISRQREIIAKLEYEGHDSSTAWQLLARFEELQELHVVDRDRLERELAAISE